MAVDMFDGHLCRITTPKSLLLFRYMLRFFRILICCMAGTLALAGCSPDGQTDTPEKPGSGAIDAAKLIGRWKSVEYLTYTDGDWVGTVNNLFVVEFFDDVLHWYDKDPDMSNPPSVCPYEIKGNILTFTVRHDPDLPSVATYTIEVLTDTQLKLCRYEPGDEHGFLFARVAE